MDFVITENFMYSLGLTDDYIALCKTLDLFVNKKASYVLGNYHIGTLTDDVSSCTYTSIKFMMYAIESIYNSDSDCIHLEYKDSKTNCDFERTISLDEYKNILSVTSNTRVIHFNDYKNGILMSSSKLYNDLGHLSSYFEGYQYLKTYEYYDDGSLYRIIYTNYKYCFNENRQLSETRIEYYDITGNIYKTLTTYFEHGVILRMEMCDIDIAKDIDCVYKFHNLREYVGYDEVYDHVSLISYDNDGYLLEHLSGEYNKENELIQTELYENMAISDCFSLILYAGDSCFLHPRNDYNLMVNDLPDTDGLIYGMGYSKDNKVSYLYLYNNIYVDYTIDNLFRLCYQDKDNIIDMFTVER